jgi:hypothetical protein
MSDRVQPGTAGKLLRLAFSLVANNLAVICLIAISLNTIAQTAPHAQAPAGDMRIDSNDPRENLHELSLHGSSLQALTPIPGGTAETVDFTRELYQMQWRGNDAMDVYIIRPKGVAKPPVVIYLYGFPIDPNRFRNDAFCKLVTKGGVAAIGFVPALTAERYHSVPMRTWFVSELHDSIVKTVHDVQMIATYAASRQDIDGSRIGIFGQGAGATIAGLAATVDPRIQAVDLLDPWGDWPAWMAKSKLVPENERGDLLKPERLQALAPLDPLHWLPALNGHSLKLDDALYENNTPAEAKAKIEAALPAHALLVRYPTQADFDKNAIADGQLVRWLQDRLQNQTQIGESVPADIATGASTPN